MSKLFTRFSLGAIVIVAVVGLAPASSSARSQWAHCGDQPGFAQRGSGWYNVRALHTRCDKARRVARHGTRTYNQTQDHRFSFQGWHCRIRTIGDELWKGSCRRDHSGVRQKVRWKFGA